MIAGTWISKMNNFDMISVSMTPKFLRKHYSENANLHDERVYQLHELLWSEEKGLANVA